jgi:hypothetical protein
VLLELGNEALEILDGHPAGGATARHARQVGGMQPQLNHAGLQSRRHIARACRIRGNRQSSNGGLHFARGGGGRFRGGGTVGGDVSRHGGRRRCVQPQAGRILGRGGEVPQDRADGITLSDLGQQLFDPARAGGGHIHGGFVRLDFDEVLVGFDFIAGLNEETDDGGFGDGLAQLRHDDGDRGHD